MYPDMGALELAQQAKRRNEARLMRMHNVVAVGIGFKTVGNVRTDQVCVVVSVIKKLPIVQLPEAARVPTAFAGVPTDVVETGAFFALQDPKEKMRPARPGISIGHYQITAGTLGCLVQKNGQVFILSNNHVLANSNNAQLGDAILQPGPADGGTSADQIGTLEQFIPVGFGISGCGCSPFTFLYRLLGIAKPRVNEPGNNTVDCAIARPLSADLVNPDILNIGIPTGAGIATLGTAVQKSGRTTGHTTDQITQVDMTVSVNYGGTNIAVFVNQLAAGPMSQGGDSGSAVLDMDRKVVGLLFAGSTSTTIMNPIQFVLDALQVQIVTA
jgi:hypothetical protein